MDRADKIKALELEIKGIEAELRLTKPQLASLNAKINFLEGARTNLGLRLAMEKKIIFRNKPPI